MPAANNAIECGAARLPYRLPQGRDGDAPGACRWGSVAPREL